MKKTKKTKKAKKTKKTKQTKDHRRPRRLRRSSQIRPQKVGPHLIVMTSQPLVRNILSTCRKVLSVVTLQGVHPHPPGSA